MPVRTHRWTPLTLAFVIALAMVTGVLARSGSGAAASPFSFALIGDVPYSDSDVATFTALVADVDDDDVAFVAHAGDIKSATQACSDRVVAARFEAFQAFDGPFWYTPGDNEWTDCHLADADVDPLERLDHLRSVFYPNPERTTGGTPMAVTPQSAEYPENVRFERECVTFGSVHQVGSGNGLDERPGETATERDRRVAEVEARVDANAAWIDQIFDRAEAASSAGVFILIHAKPVIAPAFTAVTNRITARAGRFDGEVVIAHGDDHAQEIEQNFLGHDNVTRWEVQGGDGAVSQWIAATVDCSTAGVFSQIVVPTDTSPPPTSPPTSPPPTLRPPTTAAPTTPPTDVGIDRGATAGRRAERGRQITISP